jgi:riboflavin biosynthesis pyrimidine reductase
VSRVPDFERFAERKTREAEQATIAPLTTVDDRTSAYQCQPIGNAWTRQLFDGDFCLLDSPPDVPAASLIFVQSRDGNTVVANPASLGGGPADMHLIFEGVARVAVDGVLAGAGTVGKKVFFSVWHPEIVALRRALNLPRHPAQIVVSQAGRLTIEESLLFNVPEVPVFLVIGADGFDRCERALADRPWITVVPLTGRDLGDAFRRLRLEHGLRRISVVGGRTVATALVHAGLIQDVCLTTTEVSGGTPNTPFYVGGRPSLELVVRKRGMGESSPITFEHLALQRRNRLS